jgi:hypothetical protein
VKNSERYLLGRRLYPEMISRGPWTTERVEGYVRGFYKFNPPGVRLDERSYEQMREIDPGLPEWPELLGLLKDSEYRSSVYN